MIRPAAGKKLVVLDLSQIEVRTLCWLAKDTKALDLIRDSEDIYHAFGVLLGLHDPANGQLKEFNKALRHKVKSIVLGCGYGMGPDKFSAFSGMELEEAQAAVQTYRQRMKKIVALWDYYNEGLSVAYALGEPFTIDLPSGRALNYGKLKRMRDARGRFRFIGKVVRFGQLRDFPLYGGIGCENASQGLARDIFSDMLLRIEALGHKTILHVHDEVVIECTEEEAEKVLAECLEIMSTPPAWIPDIPVSAEGEILDFYSK
jgi:DNA polymerase